MESTITQEKRLLYPPGGILIWIIMALEICTFLAAILVFVYQRNLNLEGFSESQATLNTGLGLLNTIILLTSGYFMALTVSNLKMGKKRKASIQIMLANGLGITFLVVKSLEYWQKIVAGHSISSDGFFTFYWLITGFHFAHVLLGIFILVAVQHAIKKGKIRSDKTEDLEATAVYWHMCDLIWILIFPIFYLL